MLLEDEETGLPHVNQLADPFVLPQFVDVGHHLRAGGHVSNKKVEMNLGERM